MDRNRRRPERQLAAERVADWQCNRPADRKGSPAATQAQSTSAATAASGTSSAMTQTPAPVLGVLLGLLATDVLVRRRD
ncbi:MAG: hypothetical protein MJ014_07305 [Methanocorpusculum sp.]|nr:hypothetical protein [Methanocorpusculum sp.]